jgi:hypothetical protein
MTPQYGIHQDHVNYALAGGATKTKYSTGSKRICEKSKRW